MTNFKDFIDETPLVVLPGGIGTELQRRGYLTTLPLWAARANLDALDLVTNIHRDYFAAGADVCVTNTYLSTAYAFRKVDRELEARESLRFALSAARTAQKEITGRRTFIAGSYGPLENCYSPDRVQPEDILLREHSLHAEWLAEEGVDFLLPEAVSSLPEAKAMAKAASNTGFPFFISFIVNAEIQTLDGTPLQQVLAATDLPGRIGVALHCRDIDVVDRVFSSLKTFYDGPIGLYPNGFGHPHPDLGWKFEDNANSVAKYVETALRWKDEGARMIGGCCGTTPAYIQALSAALSGESGHSGKRHV